MLQRCEFAANALRRLNIGGTENEKTIAILLALFLLAAMSGCKQSVDKNASERTIVPAESSTDSTQKPTSQESTEPTVIITSSETELPTIGIEDLVYESYSDAGEYEVVYEDGYTNSYDYYYHLPQFTDATEGARQINAAINAQFAETIESQYDAMREEVDLGCPFVSWYSVLYRDLAVIVIEADSSYEFSDYGVFCYNFLTGEWLRGRELLDYLDINADDFLAATSVAAMQCFADMFIEAPEDIIESPEYNDLMEWTGSDENINFDTLMFYPDEGGEIVVIARIASIAGADYYYQYIYPEIFYG